MHSRIFIIEKVENYNGHNSDYIESVLNDNCPCLFDYVDHFNERCDLDRDYDWLISYLKGSDDRPVVTDEENKMFYFLNGFKEAYFSERIKRFKDLVNDDKFEARFCGEEGFPGELSYQIRNTYSDESGFWVIDPNGYDLRTLDDFIRSIEYDVDYKVYEVFDYHI